MPQQPRARDQGAPHRHCPPATPVSQAARCRCRTSRCRRGRPRERQRVTSSLTFLANGGTAAAVDGNCSPDGPHSALSSGLKRDATSAGSRPSSRCWSHAVPSLNATRASSKRPSRISSSTSSSVSFSRRCG
eukprot:scaffold156539_cov26-Tisochrysis_lutea.AAC.2